MGNITAEGIAADLYRNHRARIWMCHQIYHAMANPDDRCRARKTIDQGDDVVAGTQLSTPGLDTQLVSNSWLPDGTNAETSFPAGIEPGIGRSFGIVRADHLGEECLARSWHRPRDRLAGTSQDVCRAA